MAGLLYQFARHEHSIETFTVDEQCIKDNCFEKISLVPFEGIEKIYSPDKYKMIIAIGYIQMNDIRQERYLQAKSLGYEFINYIHPSVYIHDNNLIGSNNIILDHVSIHPGTKIGNSNFISSNTNIGHGCYIADTCWINSGVGIGGETIIEDNCFIGINASLGQGIKIKKKTFIGANGLLDRDTEIGDVYLSSKSEKFKLNSDHFLAFSGAI